MRRKSVSSGHFSWQVIDKPYIHGYESANGNRKAEVIRIDTCTGAWNAFFYIDDKMVTLGFSKPDVRYPEAMRMATAFLDDGTLPKNPNENK